MKRPTSCAFGVVQLLLCLLTRQTEAFNPPLDTARPFSVGIEGPEVATKTEEPLAIPRTTCR